MIDDLHIWVKGAAIDLTKLDDVKTVTTDSGCMFEGKIGAYTVRQSAGGVYLFGSLAKYYLHNNLYTLTRATTKEALECLSDELKICVVDMLVTRVDISTVIPTECEPWTYYRQLGDKPRYKRLLVCADTLQYNTARRQLIFYDKTKEAAAKGVAVPYMLQGQNLLRYEMRLKGFQSVRREGVKTAADVYDPKIYANLIKLWREQYHSIKKIDTMRIDYTQIHTVREAKEAIFGALLAKVGQTYIDDFLRCLKAEKALPYNKAYTRLKRELGAAMRCRGKDSPISEITKAVDDIARYAR